MRTLTKENLMDILYGCAILGTGGGGHIQGGIDRINEALANGKRFRLASFDEMPDDAVIGTPYACGAISPLTEEEEKKYAALPIPDKNVDLLCMEQMEKFLGKEVSAVISTELGGFNTAIAFYCGAMTDRIIMDGDPAGRSVPALQHSTYYLKGVPMCPMSVMNDFGEGAVFTNVCSDERGEDLVRALAVVSRNSISVMDHVNTVGVIKNAIIPGAISYAEKIGKAFLQAKNNGGNFVEAVVEAGNGRQMFTGTVKKNTYETVGGYTVGDTIVAGDGAWAGHELRIWYQNENIISWLDGVPYVTVPELICAFDMDHAMPQMNPFAREGEKLSVIALPADPVWCTERGLEVFGPRSFGYDFDYKPFCVE